MFPNDAVFQDDNALIQTAGTLQSWSEEHEDELRNLPWPEQSLDLNINESLWSVLETRVRNTFPSSTSLKQLEDVLHEEWYKFHYRLFKNCTSPFQEGTRLY
jgi:hypothetical protein